MRGRFSAKRSRKCLLKDALFEYRLKQISHSKGLDSSITRSSACSKRECSFNSSTVSKSFLQPQHRLSADSSSFSTRTFEPMTPNRLCRFRDVFLKYLLKQMSHWKGFFEASLDLSGTWTVAMCSANAVTVSKSVRQAQHVVKASDSTGSTIVAFSNSE